MAVFSDAALQKTAGYLQREDASSLHNVLMTFADGKVYLKAKCLQPNSIAIRDPCSCVM